MARAATNTCFRAPTPIVVLDSRPYGPAIPGAWVIMWLLLAALDGRWLRAPNRRGWKEVATRGVVAAVAADMAFALENFGSWGDVFGDRAMASAILARILHHTVTISIWGDSYRLKDKLKSGMVKPTTAGT